MASPNREQRMVAKSGATAVSRQQLSLALGVDCLHPYRYEP